MAQLQDDPEPARRALSTPARLMTIALMALTLSACGDASSGGAPEAGADTGVSADASQDTQAPDTRADVGADSAGPDSDGDGVANDADNCPNAFNPDQLDGDDDGVGDLCDACPGTADPEQRDGDGDGVGDLCDNCPEEANTGQSDFDGDGIGNACEPPPCTSEILCGPLQECCAEGQQCVSDFCTDPCPFGVRCGGFCCGEEQLCLEDACTDIGATCFEDVDCPLDAFCDPTFGYCLPLKEEPACAFVAGEPSFNPTIEWSWTGSEVLPELDQVINMPVVGNLASDGVPDVLIVTSSGFSTTGAAVLRLLDGATGAELWSPEADVFQEAHQVQGRVTPAIGDIDGDGFPEIVTGARGEGLIAFERDGSVLWRGELPGGSPWAGTLNSATLAIADLEGDGQVEVIVSGVVFEGDGTLRFDNGTLLGSANGGYGAVTIVADLNNDGSQEIVAGNVAIQADNTPLWSQPELGDGFPAVADLDGDGDPELVVVSAGVARVQDALSGDVLASVELPASGRGGPPTVADFDADGAPEIATANGGAYVVLEYAWEPEPALSVKWSAETQDLSSNVTGSSVFDFEGDGAAEVVYNDECYLRFYSGTDGRVLYEEPNPSATIFEYPVVVDVDRDGNTEVVVAANNANHINRDVCADWPEGVSPRTGVFVYGDAGDTWVRTRRIWNQHAYHVTNINSDLTLPSPEPISWGPSGFNNYRQSIQGVAANHAPDLQVTDLQLGRLQCPQTQQISAWIINRGELSAPVGLDVAFWGALDDAPRELIGVAQTRTVIPPGGAERVTFERDATAATYNRFWVEADSDGSEGPGRANECVEDNNGGQLTTTCLCQPEVCDGVDDDCNGIIDDGFDQDGDGFTTCGQDCDDGDASINPDAEDICDRVDNDCDDIIDEDGSCG